MDTSFTPFQEEGIHRLKSIPRISFLLRESDLGLVGCSVSAEAGRFYLSADYHRNPLDGREWWRFSEPATLPAFCHPYHFTLRKFVHDALNWQKVETDE